MDVHDHRQKIHQFGALIGPQGGDLESLKEEVQDNFFSMHQYIWAERIQGLTPGSRIAIGVEIFTT